MTDQDKQLTIIDHYLSPTRPVRAMELLRGRDEELHALERELRHFGAIPFLYGERGVGKTSLATTVAQQISKSDRRPYYHACEPGGRLLPLLHGACQDLLQLAVEQGNASDFTTIKQVTLSANPGISWSTEDNEPQLPDFADMNTVIRTLESLDHLVDDNKETVIILDELEELPEEDRNHLAFLIKQIGDREIGIKFILVGIAENVQQLVGAHESVPRYIREVSLAPLPPEILHAVVLTPAQELGIEVPQDVLFRISIIANGYPHFAHLMGKYLLIEAVDRGATIIDSSIYHDGVRTAVSQALNKLRATYAMGVQRATDVYKHLVWALADSNTVDLRIDDWIGHYKELAHRLNWPIVSDDTAKAAIQKLGQKEYGPIVMNTPVTYGARKTRYRYKRFIESLMRGYVRLCAETEGVELGESHSL